MGGATVVPKVALDLSPKAASVGELNLLRNVPEGPCDRSLARSAWNKPPQKGRPVGYGVIGLIRAGVRTDFDDWRYSLWISFPDHTVPYGVPSRGDCPGTCARLRSGFPFGTGCVV